MATSLLEAGKIQQKDYESIVEAILKREELGSTGIGRGVAVPHTKHPSIEKLIGTVAISSEGVNFDSLDGEKVHLLFLLVSPPDRPGDHLRALENISRQLRDDIVLPLPETKQESGRCVAIVGRGRQQPIFTLKELQHAQACIEPRAIARRPPA